MRASARDDDGIAAACVLAAFGWEEPEADGTYVRAYCGALLLVDGLRELRAIRQALTKRE